MNYKYFIRNEKSVIGMIHISALHGTPKNKLNPSQIIELAVNITSDKLTVNNSLKIPISYFFQY